MTKHTYIANSGYAWGKGDSERVAVTKMLSHAGRRAERADEFDMTVTHVEGEAHIEATATRSWVKPADDARVLSISHHTFTGDEVAEMRERNTQFEIYLEGMLADAETDVEYPQRDDDGDDE